MWSFSNPIVVGHIPTWLATFKVNSKMLLGSNYYISLSKHLYTLGSYLCIAPTDFSSDKWQHEWPVLAIKGQNVSYLLNGLVSISIRMTARAHFLEFQANGCAPQQPNAIIEGFPPRTDGRMMAANSPESAAA